MINLFKYIIFSVLKLLSLISINKNLIVVYSGSGFGYSGHSKYLYDYLSLNFGNNRVIFVSKKKSRIGYNLLSFRGMYYVLFSKYYAIVVTMPSFVNINNKCIVQFWHGIPIKNIGLDDKSINLNKNLKNRLVEEFNKYKAIITPNDYMHMVFLNSFKISDQSILIKSPTPTILSLLGQSSKNESDLIIYAPTYRDYVDDRNWDFSNSTIYKNLVELGYRVEIYYHPLDVNYIPSSDLYSKLGAASLVITDYSSIIFDCLAINTKYCLYINDYDKFKVHRGLNQSFDINNFRIIKNTNDVIDVIKDQKPNDDFYSLELDSLKLESILLKCFPQ